MAQQCRNPRLQPPEPTKSAHSRRDFLSALGAGLILTRAPSASAGEMCRDLVRVPPYSKVEPKPLGDIDPHVLWGAHLEGAGIYDAPLLAALQKEKPKLLVIGSGLKFGNLHPLSIEFEREAEGKRFSTWTEVDDLVRLAARWGAPVRGDALVWNDWLPAWISELASKRPMNWRDRLHEVFERHFQSVFAHFDQLDGEYNMRVMPWCGVVNEPFAYWESSGGKPAWRKGAWLDAFDAPARGGAPGYIHRAFEYAAKYSRKSRPALFLNEANCDNDQYGPLLRPAMLALVDELQRAGLEINAVGLESHLQPQWMNDPKRPDWKPFKHFLKDLEARGVAIYITELDVNDCSLTDATQRDRLVAEYTGSFVSAALEVPAVTMVSSWDFADSVSWYRDQSSPNSTYPTLGRWPKCLARPACPRPTIYDQDLAPKASRDALALAFSAAAARKAQRP